MSLIQPRTAWKVSAYGTPSAAAISLTPAAYRRISPFSASPAAVVGERRTGTAPAALVLATIWSSLA